MKPGGRLTAQHAPRFAALLRAWLWDLRRQALTLASVFGVAVAGGILVTPASTAVAAARHSVRPSWQPEPATYGTVIDPNVSITMNDGVRLVGDVMYPADPQTGQRAAGRFPVLLTQNPYNCQTTAGNAGMGDPSADPTFFAQRGFIFAAICVRGTGRSGGGPWMNFGPREQQDGATLVQWAVHRLAGSNGTLGLTGCSYLGNTQLFTSGILQPGSGVKAIMPQCAGSELYRESFFSGGMPTQGLNFFGSGALTTLIGPTANAFGLGLAQDIENGGDRAYFRDYWKARTPGNWAAQIVHNGIPALLWTGWHDIAAEGAEDMYAYFQNTYSGRPTYAPMVPGQRTTPRYQVIVEPGAHGQGLDQTIELEWFDTWLRGEDTPMRVTPTPMHLYQQGSATWINTSDFPMLDHYTRYYLHSQGVLGKSRPNRHGGDDSIAYAPPTASSGSLTYTTRPLSHGATLAGPISATMYASSTSTNLNLITQLADVAPDGSSTTITSGSMVGSLRALDQSRSWFTKRGIDIRPYGTFTRDDYLSPGKAYRLDIQLEPRVTQIAPGHSLRLTIITQEPASACTALLGTDPCFPTAPQKKTLPGTYTVDHSAAMPSAINVPVLPYQCFAPTGGSGTQPDNLISVASHGTPCDYHGALHQGFGSSATVR